ncbi:unnamed protein product [Periconia digitata]|uniref:Uncharacterized protein n=1 Tax=Periconia digitata TaxID=1303443 RepID=A0A9W4UMD4_9PLEO|nr:unnamed protein product [Periconia digitata]
MRYDSACFLDFSVFCFFRPLRYHFRVAVAGPLRLLRFSAPQFGLTALKGRRSTCRMQKSAERQKMVRRDNRGRLGCKRK